ncbi:MAG TPA: diacylglycerol kinase [Desulfosarcina sp.]|nr:diacylglycerol kinase [Desulfosarcina sp.]
MEKIPLPKTGPARIWAAFRYSLDGLSAAVAGEAAFRQECWAAAVALLILALLPLSLAWKGLLLLAGACVLIVELLNSSIEAVVDMASPEYHALAKRAKDFGSAAVLLAILVNAVLWGCGLWTAFIQ